METSKAKIPEYNSHTDYFDEVFTLSFKNQDLVDEIDQVTEELQYLWKQIHKYEKKLYGKKKRRKDSELRKFFFCPKMDCGKKYAYNSSLVTHMKNKHRDV